MMLRCISLKTGEPMPIPDRTLLALGNFDGVHLAHRALLREAKSWRDRDFADAAVGVFCFRTLPADHLLADPVGHLCTYEERLSRFASCGMELAIVAEFEELRDLSPTDYVEQILQAECHCIAAACGFNHRFGKGGEGTPALLERLLEGHVLIQPSVTDGGLPISSTRIRALLAEGEPEEAARLLGAPYSFKAHVLHGKALGRRLGAPTVNQNFPIGAALPRLGVYAVSCEIDGRRFFGISNVGVHPTVDHAAPVNCETHLFDLNEDLYGKEIEISFLHFIRPERRFETAEALAEQIKADLLEARRLFNH